jgi:DNA-binding response OmpR family regulator
MKKKILIIDDAPEIVTILEDLVEAFGYQSVSAPDAELGLEKLAHEKPDLILLDLMLPGMDGFEFARKVKGDESTKNIPIIAVSVLREEEHRKRGQEAGMDDYVTKPFDPKDLVARIKKLLP